MALTLFTLYQVILLTLNGLCVLNKERFLSKFFKSPDEPPAYGGYAAANQSVPISTKFVQLVYAVKMVMTCKLTISFPSFNQQSVYFSDPLIFLNMLTILVKMVVG